MIYAALTQFKIRCNLSVFFPTNLYSQNFSFKKPRCSASLARGESTVSLTRVKDYLFDFFFILPLPSPFILSYPILCIKTNQNNFHKNCTSNGFEETRFCHGCFTSTFLSNSLIYWLILFIPCVVCHMSFVRCHHFSERSGINGTCPF